MITLAKLKDLRAAIRQQKQLRKRIAFVPTMGNLHAGHIELVRRGLEAADYVVTSIFVNPLQFGANEDLDKYPRTLEADKAQLVNAGNHVLYTPTISEIYPRGSDHHTRVSVPDVTQGHCGKSRPGHFEGVATVVNILFNQVQPDIAFFGEKDYQQVAVIRKMVRDLCLPVQIESVPTVRDANGLALSSRNGYLDVEQKQTAATLYRVLCDTAEAISGGENDYGKLTDEATRRLIAAGFVVDYFSIAHSETLAPASAGDQDITLLAAAFLGNTRLIDNLSLTLQTSG